MLPVESARGPLRTLQQRRMWPAFRGEAVTAENLYTVHVLELLLSQRLEINVC